MLNRRTFVLGAALAGAAKGAVVWGEEMRQGETAIQLIPIAKDDEPYQGFMVGVRTPANADRALVEVFYKTKMRLGLEAKEQELYLSDESVAPIAGNDAWGGTRKAFTMPRESVQFIRVTLLADVGEPIEFGR
jgi:hypothetical protein